jgi:glutamine amidotransferase
MGWNDTHPTRASVLFPEGDADENRFYYVHSFHAVCDDAGDVLAKTHHGYEFDAVVGRDNIVGVQFHPEKSHKFGMRLLRNFVEQT